MSLAPVTNRAKRGQPQQPFDPNYGMANIQDIDPGAMLQAGGLSPLNLGGGWQNMMQGKVDNSELMRQLLNGASGQTLFGL